MGSKQIERKVLNSFWSALNGISANTDSVSFTGQFEGLSSRYNVAPFASAAVGAATLAVAEIWRSRNNMHLTPQVIVARAHAGASYFCDQIAKPIGWNFDQDAGDISGNYETSDGWIRIHTMYNHHRRATLKVLNCSSDKELVKLTIKKWKKSDLEHSIVEAGGAAAELRSPEEWRVHPQGIAIRNEPLFLFEGTTKVPRRIFCVEPKPGLPLYGLRVLDMTRVLAGPIGARFLAGYGADVIRIDPINFHESNALLIETTRGKRTLGLDINEPDGSRYFENLIRSCDVLIHGLRPGAMERLGFSLERIAEINPGILVVRHCAYGWSGPWHQRRGFDSLVQMSSGIAFDSSTGTPKSLPAQALDYTTGYLIAAAACRGLSGTHLQSKLSLARTAVALTELGHNEEPALPPFQNLSPLMTENTSDWGLVLQLDCPGMINEVKPTWTLPACKISKHSQIDWLA